MSSRRWSWLAVLPLVAACDGAKGETPPMPTHSQPSSPGESSASPAKEPAKDAADAQRAPEGAAPGAGSRKGVLLWNLTWLEAKEVLTPDTVVVIPVGAASKEHGPHLLLKNDWLLAEYYKERVVAAAEVVVIPTIGYHFYPAFVEYAGSTTLSRETSREMVVEICRGLSRFGPRRFYVLNTGVSTVAPLKASAEVLAAEGIVMRYTNILEIAAPVEKEISEQPGGTHADEIETSMMLYIAPETVDMSKAVRDWAPKTKKGLSPTPDGPGHYSKSGIWGDPTLATLAKGERVVEAMVEGMLRDIEDLRAAPVSQIVAP